MYENFKTELIHSIKTKLDDSYRIVTYKAFKDGKEKEAFTISKDNASISPTFYFKNFYPDYEEGKSILEIATEIIELYFYAENENTTSAEDIADFQKQKDSLCYRVVNKEGYKAQLPNIPYVDFFDLAIIFYGIISIDDHAEKSFTITNDILNLWGISKEELALLAAKNTPKLLPLTISSISSIMFNIDVPQYDKVSDTINNLPSDYLYTLTNEYCRNGFSGILYPNVLKLLGEKFGNFYILPSSRHEALIIPEEGAMPPNELMAMVKSVNTDVVSPDEYLSDSIYQYDTKADKIHAYQNTTI